MKHPVQEIKCIFSEDRIYRYVWETQVNYEEHATQGACTYIGLNPSTADEYKTDPTVFRCAKRAQRLGFAKMVMLNLFAYRATYPKDMMRAADPIGPDNDKWITKVMRESDLLVLVWGSLGVYRNRYKKVINIISPHSNVMCLGKTKAGMPRHPLYIRNNKELEVYSL